MTINKKIFSFLTMVLFLASSHAEAKKPRKRRKAHKEKKVSKATEPSMSAKPWAKGVSKEAKAKALSLFEKGNEFFVRSQYSQALSEYQKAIQSWDHPAIRYNMAVCQINLDQPLEAYTNLGEGLKYEGSAINQELYAAGKTYMKLLKARLSWLTVSVKEPGAKVSLDGNELFTGPGESRQLLLPGKHQIIARKELMLTETKTPILEGGAETNIVLTMRPLSEGVVLRRRWDSWKPWAVLGGGVGVTTVGGLLYLLAGSNYDTYDAQVSQTCPTGCALNTLPSSVTGVKDRADLQSISAASLLITGGALVLGGGVLLYLNRERAVNIEDFQTAPTGLTIVPTLGPKNIGFASSFRF